MTTPEAKHSPNDLIDSTGWRRDLPSDMLPPFCASSCQSTDWRHKHQKRKLEMLRFWRDGIERQLAAINAAISTLEGQIERDQPTVTQG